MRVYAGVECKQAEQREHGKRWCFDVVSPYRSYTLQARRLVITPPPTHRPSALHPVSC